VAKRVVWTTKQLAAERQIHAAILHFRSGDFECAITLCSAAEGQMPETSEPVHLFGMLKRAGAERRVADSQRDDFNFAATWMKHSTGHNEIEIEEWVVTIWLNRAISKYRAIYGIGTPEMAALFPWAGAASSY